MASNMEALGEVLNDFMKKTVRANQTVGIELGTIQAGYSLKTDHFLMPIPAGEYMVCENIQLRLETSRESSGSTAQADGHAHAFPHTHIVERCLQPGDRVLVVWAGREPVVVDVVKGG